MKSLLTLLFCLAVLGASAQTTTLPTDSATGKIVYRGAVPLPAGVTQAQAFGRAKIWLADAFASKAVLAEDAASGLLSGGGLVMVKDLTYTFRVRLQVEAGQVRYRLDNFAFSYYEPAYHMNMTGTPEGQRDSKAIIGKGGRERTLASFDQKVRAGITQLGADLTGGL